MTKLTGTHDALLEVVDDEAPAFFAPVPAGALNALFARYDLARRRIDQVAAMVAGDLGPVVDYFINGNAGDKAVHRSLYVDRLFQVSGAVAALNSDFWSQAMALTDVLSHMPANDRNAWHEAIRTHKTPDFTRTAVLSTLTELLNSRQRFFAMRVDGIFRALSDSHLTNRP